MRRARLAFVLLGAAFASGAGCRGQEPAQTAPGPGAGPDDAGVDGGRDVEDVDAASPAPPIVTHARALVAAPRYVWTEGAADVGNVIAALGQAGVPFDVQAVGTDWGTTLADLSRYSLVVVPGYLLGAAVDGTAREKLEAFAEGGGVVVVFKPTGTPGRSQALRLVGLTASVRRRDLLGIRFDAQAPALSAIDTDEERVVPVNRSDPRAKAPRADGVEIYVLSPDAHAKTQVLAHAVGAPVSAAGPAVTRRPLGRGAIYAFGHDLSTFAVSRCYVNCFEARGDLLRLVLEGAHREGALGHWAQLHTVPGPESSVLLVTFDLDTPDAFRTGPWGAPGAIQALAVARTHDVAASFNVTAGLVRDANARETLRMLCEGGCAIGAHGVLHPASFAKIPRGSCKETPATYGSSPTLCGEVRGSRAMLAEMVGRAPRVWRSPNLAFHPAQLDVLASNAIPYDSSFGVGDLPFNLPIDAERHAFFGARAGEKAVLELPVSCLDVDEPAGLGRRPSDLGAASADAIVARWEHIVRKNLDNRSFTTLLVHPTRGAGMGDENLRVKMAAVGRLLDRVLALDITTRTLESTFDFWRARLETKLEVEHVERKGYVGALVAGSTVASGLTLEFAEPITSFECDACPETSVHGRRVVIGAALVPGARYAFVAKTN